MTKLQLQNEILKEFKRRLRREYGKWTDMYKLEVKKFDRFNAGDLLKLKFESEFHSVTIIFDNCLNITIKCEGTGMISQVLRCFMDVADDCETWIRWLFSHDAIHAITWRE